MNEEQELRRFVSQVISEELEADSMAAFHLALQERIRDLLDNDFQKLLWILYRIDVNEQKLTTMLAENPDKDPALVITDAVIERQKQKIETRKKYSGGSTDKDKEW